MFASKTPRDLNRDPEPFVWRGTKLRSGTAHPGEAIDHAPRVAFDAVQHNPSNPILVRFRKWVEGETLADPSWAAEWVEAMDDVTVESDAARVLDVLYETPYRRRERAAHELHARAVISRLALLAESAEEV